MVAGLMPTAFAVNTITVGAFTVTSSSTLIEGTDYSYSNGTLTILSDTAVTIANTDPNTPTSDAIAVADGVNANITLAGVNIDLFYSSGACAFRIADNSTGNVTITLAAGTINTLRSGDSCAGLQKNGNASSGMLTITGTGTLTVQGGFRAAGIGGGNGDTANITIEGGTITATGGYYGAGIGGGFSFRGTTSNIKITGGMVTANGGRDSAGIGGGGSIGTGSNITIEGGTVTANGGINGAGIGGGNGGNGSNIIISGGSVKATPGADGNAIGGGNNGGNGFVTPTNGTAPVYLLEMDGASSSLTIDGKSYPTDHGDGKVYAYLSEGEHTIVKDGVSTTHTYKAMGDNTLKAIVLDFAVTATNSGETLVLGEDYTYPTDSGVLTILSDKAITIRNIDPSMATSNTIVVAAGVNANITLAGVKIEVLDCAFMIEDNSAGNVTITLADGTANTLKSGYNFAGLQKNSRPNDGTLTITGTGALTAQGGGSAAGIGSTDKADVSNITINGGTVTATGGNSGAGIGGGVLGEASNITISGGTVIAQGGRSGAGIGGGDNSNGHHITISGGRDGNGAITPTNGTESVYLLEVENTGGADLAINGTDYPDAHISYGSDGTPSEEAKIYAYLPAKSLTEPNVVNAGSVATKYYLVFSPYRWIRVIDDALTITLDAPTTESALDTTAQLANDTYIESISVTWKVGTQEAVGDAKCDTVYTAEITVTPKSEYAFCYDATAQVNGNAANVTNANGVITVTYTFGKTAHVWGETVYEWSENAQSCTATRTCKGDATHVETQHAIITNQQTKAPTCTQPGETTYTAAFEKDWAGQQTKVLADVPATGHAWGAPVYTWGEDGKTCVATRACQNDAAHTETAVASITPEQTKDPTYTEPGETTYTATFTESWATAQTKTVADIPATGSDWYATEYRWSEDGKTCTASRTHKTEQGRVETLTVTATGRQVKAPTCTEDGTTLYTAFFTVEWATLQSKAVVDLPATGHSWGEAVYNWSDDANVCTATRTCMNDATHVQTADATIAATKTKEPTCTEKGATTYTASFEVGWAEEQMKVIADLPATGHGETKLENVKEATCTAKGYTGDKVCKVCGEVVEQGKVIPQLAHSYKDGKCTVCGVADPNYKPTEPGDEDTNVPETGNNSNIAVWIALIFITACGLTGTMFYGRKKKYSK